MIHKPTVTDEEEIHQEGRNKRLKTKQIKEYNRYCKLYISIKFVRANIPPDFANSHAHPFFINFHFPTFPSSWNGTCLR